LWEAFELLYGRIGTQFAFIIATRQLFHGSVKQPDTHSRGGFGLCVGIEFDAQFQSQFAHQIYIFRHSVPTFVQRNHDFAKSFAAASRNLFDLTKINQTNASIFQDENVARVGICAQQQEQSTMSNGMTVRQPQKRKPCSSGWVSIPADRLTRMKESRLENSATKDCRQRFEQLSSKQFGFGRIGINAFLEHFFARAAQWTFYNVAGGTGGKMCQK
jgi:hypothetical protein